MNENVMTYEYFIRQVHQCGRDEVAVTEIDTFRRFERCTSSHEADKNNLEKIIEVIQITNQGFTKYWTLSSMKVVNIKVCIPLKLRNSLTGDYHAICHYLYNLPLCAICRQCVSRRSKEKIRNNISSIYETYIIRKYWCWKKLSC